MKINKMPEFYMILARKINKIPNFCPQMPYFYIIIARKIFFPDFFFFGGGGTCPLPPSPTPTDFLLRTAHDTHFEQSSTNLEHECLVEDRIKCFSVHSGLKLGFLFR